MPSSKGKSKNQNKQIQLTYINSDNYIKISNFNIRYHILRNTNYTLLKNLELLKEYFEKFHNYRTVITSYEDLLDFENLNQVLTPEKLNQIRPTGKEFFKCNISFMHLALSEVLEAYKVKNKLAENTFFHNNLTNEQIIFNKYALQRFLDDKQTSEYIGIIYRIAKFNYPSSFLRYLGRKAEYGSYSEIRKIQLKMDAYFIYKLLKEEALIDKYNFIDDFKNKVILVDLIKRLVSEMVNFNNEKIKEGLVGKEDLSKNFEIGKFQVAVNIILHGMYDFLINSSKLHDHSISDYNYPVKEIELKVLLKLACISDDIIKDMMDCEEGIIRSYRILLLGRMN